MGDIIKKIRVNEPENQKVTYDDLLELTKDGELRWIKVEANSHYHLPTFRCLYKGRIYILESSGKLSVWNCRNDGMIWFNQKAMTLVAYVSIISKPNII